MQWDNLVRKLCSPSSPTACLECRWEFVTESFQRQRFEPVEVRSVLKVTHNWAVALVAQQHKASAQRRSLSWKEWKRDQCAAGETGGAFFHFF